MSNSIIEPVIGCFVRQKGQEKPIGFITEKKIAENKQWLVLVQWGGERTPLKEWRLFSELSNGMQRGFIIQHVPLSITRTSLGTGVVVGSRSLGGYEQVLVQLHDNGKSVWLPFERIKRIKDAQMRFVNNEIGCEDHAERFRLKFLAHALENWNQLTGALDRLDIDPLPHQIHLVHSIIRSGNYNWLIADDVGLGKTIEVGLLLAAMKRNKMARRVLIVCPAGLTRQWQDEMKYKFDQEYFIYGSDFHINKIEHWKQFDHVIVSLDRAKQEDHMNKFIQSGGWDIIIFDEAHKLSRYGDGTRTERYKVAEAFREMTDSFLLLTATPHQGYDDRFKSLLKLIRPDLEPQIDRLRRYPEVVSEMILRNRKSLVTNSEGEFIFQGQEIKRVAVRPSDETEKFNSALKKYLKNGYKSSERQGAQGRAIGFVMTTFRKLASSSIASIEGSLQRRKKKIEENILGNAENRTEEFMEEDMLEGGDHLDDDINLSSLDVPTFFDDEIQQISELLILAETVKKNDEKLKMFLEDIVAPVFDEGKKLLIFTEYRGTQSYLKESLKKRFPTNPVIAEINGSKNIIEKMEAIDQFNDNARFLISTEAGGEGLNLQESCHIMVNYDLPWNPARLVQRIGRLYRYGQTETVLVFNLHARDSFDNSVIDLMLTRVDSIVDGMSSVGKEFNKNFHAEVLGNILENIDMLSVLRSASDMEISRTKLEIDKAIEKAKRAVDLQDELFECVNGYEPGSMVDSIFFTMDHVNSFIEGMFYYKEVVIRKKIHSGKVLEIKLPDSLKGKFPEFENKTVVRITTDRNLSRKLREVVLVDFENSFFRYMIKKAKLHEFDGIYSNIHISNSNFTNLVCFNLRWQNDQGQPTQDEFVSIVEMNDGRIMKNPSILSGLLVEKFSSTSIKITSDTSKEKFKNFSKYANDLLRKESNKFKQPNGCVVIMGSNIKTDECSQ